MTELFSARFSGYQALQACANEDAAHLTEALVGQELPHVTEVQQALIDLGCTVDGGADGHYGAHTGDAVAEFKTARGLFNAGGQIDRVVGKLTIAALDSDIDEYDDPPPPCFVTTPIGAIAPAGFEAPLNRLLDLTGAGGLASVDDDGNVFDLTAGEVDGSSLLEVSRTGNNLLDDAGTVEEFTGALLALAAQPAVAGLPGALAALTTPPALLVDFSEFGSGLVAHLLAGIGTGPTAVVPARDLSPQQALDIVLAAHAAGELVLTPDPTVTRPVAGKPLAVTSAPIGRVLFKGFNGFPNHKAKTYAPVATPLFALDARHLVGLLRLARHLADRWSVTEVHHTGISGDPARLGGDCHQAGRACDLIGIRLTHDGVDRVITVWNEWWGSTVPDPARPGKRLRDCHMWPG
jgi:hypothetical protein